MNPPGQPATPLRSCIIFILAACALHAQSFVYTNDSVSPNTVTGWSVDSQGRLSQIAGAPFATAGRADGVALSFTQQNFTANRIITSKAASLLFASNDSDGTISVFNLNPTTGTLSLVSGSPFAALGACNAGYSLAVTPDGKTLAVGTSCSAALKVFSIAPNGSLTLKSSQALSGCGSSGGITGSLRFTWDSQYLADADQACGTVEMFQLSANALQLVAGSPFRQRSTGAAAYSVDIGCANASLYMAGTQGTRNTVSAFSLSAGIPSELSASPYSSSAADLQSAALTVDDQFLVVSGWNSTKFTVFVTGSGGSLSQVAGSPFGFGDLSPAQVTVSADGKFIFFAEDTGDPSVTPGVGVLAISNNGTLTQVAGSPFRNPRASFIGGNDAVAAFPPKACQAAGPVLSVSPGTLTFNTPVGTRSASQPVTVSNTGSANVTISNITVSDNFGFSLDLTSCLGTTLQPRQSCTVAVTYLPQSAGTKTTSLLIANTGFINPLTVSLTGIGGASVLPAITFNPQTYAFKSMVVGTATPFQPVQVVNSGTAPLIISAITPSDTRDFSIDASLCIKASPIAPGASCNVQIRFNPTSLFAFSANYTVTSNADANPASNPTGMVTGTAIAPKACPDADGDGLCDDWEQNGVFVLGGFNQDVYVFVDLPRMGADPRHKDLFIHADWLESDPEKPGYHSHQPRLNSMKLATDAYAKGLVTNPDGTPGVTLHVDCGPDCVMNPKTGETWGTRSYASSLPEIQAFANLDGSTNIPYDWTQFDTYSAAFNITGRKFAFRHVMFVHDQALNTSSSGVARGSSNRADFLSKGASDLIVSLGSWDAVGQHTDLAEAGTLMHETGHTLSLEHGGRDESNDKPNYLTVMNYNFQTAGLIVNKRQSVIDYSRFALPDLDEFHLNETVGLNGGSAIAAYGTAWFCPGAKSSSVPMKTNNANGAINWDCDAAGKIVTQTAADINAAYTSTGQPSATVLKSFTDWDKLLFAGGAIGGQGAGDIASETVSSASEYNVESAVNNVPLTRVHVTAPSGIALTPGGSVTVTLLVSNTGSLADSYTLSAPAIAGWFTPGVLPGTVTLQPGASVPFRVTLSAPATAKVGDRRIATLFAASTVGDLSDSGQIVIVVAKNPDPLAIASTGINFGSKDAGTQSSPTAILIANTGQTPLSIAGISITGDFTQTTDCGSSLAPGASCTIMVTFVPTAGGVRSGRITINDNSSSAPHVITLQGTATIPAPVPQVNATVNAATQVAGSQSPGALFTLYGVNMASGQTIAASLPLPRDVKGTTLTIGGFPAAFTYGDANQINAQIPFEVQPGPADFQLQTADGHIAAGTIQIAAVSPGVFLIPGTQHAAAGNQDYSVNMTAKPAAPGSVITLYYTGQGAVDQPIATGAPSPSSPPARTIAATTVTFGGQPATVLFSGMTPTLAGLAQANIQVPATLANGSPLPPGEYSVILTVGGVAANPVNISVGPAQ